MMHEASLRPPFGSRRIANIGCSNPGRLSFGDSEANLYVETTAALPFTQPVILLCRPLPLHSHQQAIIAQNIVLVPNY
jgi:hypothetical protein